jgi:uncharacterized membrane protein YvlD (DUF360 family)
MTRLSSITKAILRFALLWFIDGISLLITAAVLPGIAFLEPQLILILTDAFAAAFLLSIVNLMIRPIVLLLARPLGFIAVFILGFLVNALALLLTSQLLPVFEVSGLLSAIVGGLVFAAINIMVTGILEVNDEGSVYQSLIERLARRQSYAGIDPAQRGLVMLEIDGLSYHHVKAAIADGRLPALKRMMQQEGFQLSRVDCGIPSQTSACQAGIMFGDNSDIPAFRWYDKDQQKLFVSGSDAAELNSRYANGNGLMRGGASINNMLDGDAQKSLLTLADLFVGDSEEKKRRAEDIYLLMLNPYFLARTIVLFLVDVVREVWEGWQQKRRDVQPRLNRLAHGYPFVRAATTVLMRDIAANLAILDIIRGAPSIYVTWPGYDEVAHHSGPWTSDAFKVLAAYDHVIDRVHRTIREKAPRPYDLIVLSDHGQSFGPTFKQRYGLSLKELIEQQLPQGTTVAQSMGGDTGVTSLTAASGELENIQQSGVGGGGGRALARAAEVARPERARQEDVAGDPGHDQPAQVTAYGSGNLAQVYFDLYARKITLSELNMAYPGMVAALVQHDGIGLVCGYDDEGAPVALGKGGVRHLHTGEVTGEDPLLPYAPEDPNAYGHASLETRVWQVQRVMDFPHAGDLMVISTVYPDGTVAALEELIGNHGGLGGEQTDAFLFHPPDLAVPPTRNSIDVFHILNDRRGQPVIADAARTGPPAEPPAAAWSLANLWAGLRDVRTWLPLAGRALVLDRSAYQEVVDDERMTGPALLLGLGLLVVFTWAKYRPAIGPLLGLLLILASIAFWFVQVLGIHVAGRVIADKGSYTRTLRGLGFAHVVTLVNMIGLLPALASLAAPIGTWVSVIAVWMGAAVAHNARGWRSIILPFLGVIFALLVPLIGGMMVSGAVLSLESLLAQLGLLP